jgi:aryl-alcohol dehydrogenase
MTEAVAAVYRGEEGRLSLEKVQIDDPRGSEIIVRTVGSGVCHTDLTLMDQNLVVPGILGHEGSGIVEKVGPCVTKVQPGDHVVVSIPSCGQCGPCLQGRPTYCARIHYIMFVTRAEGPPTISTDGVEIDHSYASSWISHMMTTERCVAKVDQDVPLEFLGPLGCGVQTGVGAVVNALKPEPGSAIAIYGMGTVGQSAVMGAAICGCTKIIAIDVDEKRLEMAREFGATHTINPSATDPVDAVFDVTGEGADYSLECAGIPEVFQNAVYSIHTRGVCGLLGFPPQGTEVSLNMEAILWGRTIKGIIEGDSIIDIFIPRLIDFHKAGKLPFDRLLSVYAFDDIEKACHDLRKGLVFKPIIRF